MALRHWQSVFDLAGLSSRGYGFSSGHVWMGELDLKESWAPKDWCFWTMVLEKTLESPLEYKEIQPVYLKGNQSWICWSWSSNILTTRCEELIHWRRPWCWERLNAGGEGDNGGWDGWMASPTQWTWVWVNSGSWWWTGGLACCDSWGRKESDMTERLNWTDLKKAFFEILGILFLFIKQEEVWFTNISVTC